MSAMVDTTPMIATIKNTGAQEKAPNETDAMPRANILNFCEEHYDDILPIIMDRIRRDKRKEVHTKLDFEGSSKKTQKARDYSLNSSDGSPPARHRHTLEKASSRNHSQGRNRLRVKDLLRGVKESYGDTQSSRGTKTNSTSNGGRWKSKGKRHGTIDEDLAVPWTCKDVDPFTPRIRNFQSSWKTRMPNNVKTYDGIDDPEDHLKIFQAVAQVERWATPTWYHMFNSTLIGAARVWFYELPPESIDGYKDLKAAFLAYFMQQKKDGRPSNKAASKKKVHTPWKSQDQSKRHTSVPRPDFRSQPKDGRGSSKFTPLTRTPKEIFAAESGKFKPPPPMVTPVEKRSINKFCEFHNDKGHNTDECVQLKKQIEELVRAGKLSHFIKEIRQDKDQQKTGKKDAPAKDKAATIYMIQPWQRVTRQKVTQSFDHVREITFPPLTVSKGTEGLFVIEAKIGGHAVHRMYVDGGSSMEVLFEHCFNRLWPKIKSQMVPAITSLTGFSGETIWPLGQLRLLVTIRDAKHSTKACMNFMIVRSPSPYNGIIGRPGIIEIQAVPSTAHGMIKFSVNGRIVTICSTTLTPTECAAISATPKDIEKKAETRHKNFKVAIHLDFPDQEIAIGGALSAKGRTIVILSQRLIGRSSPYAAILLNASWTHTKATIKYRWQKRMKKRRLSIPSGGILLHQNALRPQERWGHVPAAGGQGI
ncbi:reverse transcriptase domain-containing protein [Tanacetum coccineum]